MAVLNDFKSDLRKYMGAEGVTFRTLESKTGIKQPNMSRTVSQVTGRTAVNIINRTFVKMFEALGYDIMVMYIKRKKDNGDTQ